MSIIHIWRFSDALIWLKITDMLVVIHKIGNNKRNKFNQTKFLEYARSVFKANIFFLFPLNKRIENFLERIYPNNQTGIAGFCATCTESSKHFHKIIFFFFQNYIVFYVD